MIKLSEAKMHLRILHNYEDELIEIYINASTKHCEQFLNRPLVIEGDDISGNSDIKLGCLMLIGHFHENRETVVITGGRAEGVELPMSSKALWATYRCINV